MGRDIQGGRKLKNRELLQSEKRQYSIKSIQRNYAICWFLLVLLLSMTQWTLPFLSWLQFCTSWKYLNIKAYVY